MGRGSGSLSYEDYLAKLKDSFHADPNQVDLEDFLKVVPVALADAQLRFQFHVDNEVIGK